MSDNTDLVNIGVKGAKLTFDSSVGNIPALEFELGERKISPLHTAHWVGSAIVEADPNIPLVDKMLSGDFLCAPFGDPNDPETPPHGWSANSHWSTLQRNAGECQFELDRKIQGATFQKTLKLIDDHSVLYQTHTIDGGQGALTLAHHPMVHIGGKAAISYSPKSIVISPDVPLVKGRNHINCGLQQADLKRLQGIVGGFDLTEYPTKQGHEDFVTLVEQPGRNLGWTAIVREEENDIIVILKDPRVLPITMLWFSNGGRDYFPWDGKHIGVLGVEDGIAAGAAGFKAAQRENPISNAGAKTVLELEAGTKHEIRHAIAVLARPEGWQSVENIKVADGKLSLTSTDGAELIVPFDSGFLRS